VHEPEPLPQPIVPDFDVAGMIQIINSRGHIRSMEVIEADILRMAIAHYNGQLSEVARRLGIGRSTLYRKIADFGLETAQTGLDQQAN
jgi:DNA-binding NtrC family response regulator